MNESGDYLTKTYSKGREVDNIARQASLDLKNLTKSLEKNMTEMGTRVSRLCLDIVLIIGKKSICIV